MVWPVLAALYGGGGAAAGGAAAGGAAAGSAAGGGILASPWLHLGLGVLSQMQEGGNPAAGALGGLQSYQGYRQGQLRNQLVNQQLQQQEQQAQFRDWLSNQWDKGNRGNVPTPAPGQSSSDGPPQTMLAPSRVSAVTPQDIGQRMMSVPGMEQAGLGILTQSPGETWRPMTAPEKEAYGVPPSQAAQISSTGKISTPGAPMVSQTIGGAESEMDKPLKPADMDRFADSEGNPPPTIMTPRQLQERGYTLQRKPTEGGRRAGYVADSLGTASDNVKSVLDDPDFDPTSLVEAAGGLTNWTASSEYQTYKSAADEWATNMVFLRSGATARKEEKDSAFANFWPQPGDKPKTIQFKRIFRLEQEQNAYAMAAQEGRVTSEKARRMIKKRQKEIDMLRSGGTRGGTPSSGGVVEWNDL